MDTGNSKFFVFASIFFQEEQLACSQDQGFVVVSVFLYKN